MITISEALERFEWPDGFDRFARRFNSFEGIWTHCDRADWMMYMLGNIYKGNLRKLRLFTVGCARRWWHFLPDVRSQRAVIAAERYAQGEVARGALDFMREGAYRAAEESASESKPMLSRAARMAVLTLEEDCLAAAMEASQIAAQAEHTINGTNSYEHELVILATQADQLRKLLGNPFAAGGIRTSVAAHVSIL